MSGRRISKLALLILFGCLSAVIQAMPPPEAPAEEPVAASGITVRYMLQNHLGRVITDQEYLGKYQFITFGYTHCPDVCPTTLAEMAQVLNRLGDKAERIQPLFVTVDPERDTPQRLAQYVAYFHPSIVGLTGTPELVEHAAKNFRVRFEKVRDPQAPPDEYWMDHSAGIFLLGPNEEFLEKFPYATSVDDMVKRLEELIE